MVKDKYLNGKPFFMKRDMLMVYDWVQVHQFYTDVDTGEKVFYSPSPIPMQVGEIYDSVIGTIAPWSDPKDNTSYDEATLDEIEPITLTREILEANHFKPFRSFNNDNGCTGKWFHQSGSLLIMELTSHEGLSYTLSKYEKDKNENRTSFSKVIGIQYVHTLQQAIRLMGYRKIARKIKINTLQNISQTTP